MWFRVLKKYSRAAGDRNHEVNVEAIGFAREKVEGRDGWSSELGGNWLGSSSSRAQAGLRENGHAGSDGRSAQATL